MLRLVTFAFVFLFACSRCGAQQSIVLGPIEGTITDNTHLPVPNASVQVFNKANGESRIAVTGVDGDFHVLGLPIATYEVRANAPGFARYTQTGIVLAMG